MIDCDKSSIVRSYQQAKNKTEQVFILADLTLSDTDTIIEILTDAGVIRTGDLHKRICCRCGTEYVTTTFRGTPVCDRCQGITKEISALEYQLKRITAQIQGNTRNIGELRVKSEKIRKEIQKLKREYEA